MWGGEGGGAYGEAVGGVLPHTDQDRDSLGCTDQRTAEKCVGGQNSLFLCWRSEFFDSFL